MPAVQAGAKAAGREAPRFHDLRHTFGTRMAAAGVPMRTLQEWMGHRDFQTTLIYADYTPPSRTPASSSASRGSRQGPVGVPKSPNLSASQST